ncbi:MAG: PAC2 family protein [Dehalococcoidia bacterium]|nr:PAC2 family protein [Dehalococcoidia bacterium]
MKGEEGIMGVGKKRGALYKLYRRPRPERCTMLASWPGVGDVSLIIARYLKDKLDFVEIGEIDAVSFFEPVGVMVEENIVKEPHFPESKFYYWRGNKDSGALLLFIGEEQPASKGYEMVSCVLDVAQKLAVERIYSCAAAITRIHYSEKSKVWGVATKPELLGGLSQYDIVLKGDLRIAGLNGLILGMAKERDIEGVCLLGEVPGYATQMPNPEASLSVIEVLTRMLRIEVDLTDLGDWARRAEEQMERMTKQATAAFIDHFTEPIWEQAEAEEEEADEDEDDEDGDEERHRLN